MQGIKLLPHVNKLTISSSLNRRLKRNSRARSANSSCFTRETRTITQSPRKCRVRNPRKSLGRFKEMARKLQRTIYQVNHRLDPWKCSCRLCSSCTVSTLHDCGLYSQLKRSDITCRQDNSIDFGVLIRGCWESGTVQVFVPPTASYRGYLHVICNWEIKRGGCKFLYWARGLGNYKRSFKSS